MPQNPKSSKADEDQYNLDSEESDMDPDDRKVGERSVRAGRDDDEGLEEQRGHRVSRVSRKPDDEDDDDLAEDSMEALDEDDLKNMEGPDA
jgi:hypothetical protein